MGPGEAPYFVSVSSACFSPDGSAVLTTYGDGLTATVGMGNPIFPGYVSHNVGKLWCAASGECLRTLLGHEDAIYFGNFSPDGCVVLTASSDQKTKLWDAQTGTCTHSLHSWEDTHTACFAPNQQTVFTGSLIGGARLWHGSECTHFLTEFCECASFSPDSSTVLVGSGCGLHLWDVANGECIRTLATHSWDIDFSFHAYPVSRFGRTLVQLLFPYHVTYRMARFSHDGSLIYAAFTKGGMGNHDSKSVSGKLWSSKSGQCGRAFPWIGRAAEDILHEPMLVDVSFGADRHTSLFAGVCGSSIQLGTLESCKECLLRGHTQQVNSVSF
ncbi:unnamed protein product [Polarella glacialis]|uniref:Uncharacterized protein n=2 Tax=Polarella glacialis TaxID=89957 RepID=A0A813FQQ6_POLGL|nr:unnamed protein product [Polarella glacialis]